MPSIIKHTSSYRDPSGFIFYHNAVLYRQVNQCFKNDFDQFISSGLYQNLVDKNLLVPHKTLEVNYTGMNDCYKTLEPEVVPFISYPYEWCFDMLKEAALLTVSLAQEAIKYGMILKDASAFNVQWHKGRMKFIDSLSFERYDETKPWVAYRQFCEHFLAPLALMHYKKWPLQNLLLAYPDGIPIRLAKKLLPFKSRFHLHTYLHLHLHARMAEKSNTSGDQKSFSSAKLKNLLKSLEEAIRSFSLQTTTGVWSGYYEEAFQREDYVVQKREIIESWIKEISPLRTAIDVGANEGEFSMLLAQKNIQTISADFDHHSVNSLFQRVKKESNTNILPLVMDFANPSPAIGVNNEERSSFINRVRVDLVLALALIHHLSIGKNIPFEKIAKMLSSFGKYLIIEFVPKTDEKIQLMLKEKKDIYRDYTEENFVNIFSQVFSIVNSKQIGTSGRILYLMKTS